MVPSYSSISNWAIVLQDNEDTKKPKRRKIKKFKNGLSAEDNKDQVGKDKKEQDLNAKTDLEVKKEDETAKTETEVKDGTDIENSVNENGETTNEEVMNVNKEVKDDSEEMKSEETKMEVSVELEDGECSDSSEDGEKEDNDDDDDSSSNASTATISDEGKQWINHLLSQIN